MKRKNLYLTLVLIICLSSGIKGQINTIRDSHQPVIHNETNEGNEITEKLIYQIFFQEKDPHFYNEGMRQNFKRLDITGPCTYSIFSNDLLELGKKCEERYTQWKQKNGEEYVVLDFVNTSDNVLKSYFDTQDGEYQFNITNFSINYKNENEAYVEISYDDSELTSYYGEKPERIHENKLNAQKGNETIILIKEGGKWKVDNILSESPWGNYNWKKELTNFLKNPTEYMPYYDI